MSRRSNGQTAPNTTSTVLFLGQIPFDWDENNLRSVVCGSGKVVDVRLGFDYQGKNKGFAFVEFQTHNDAVQGMRTLSQIMVHGPNQRPKRLRVELSKESLRSNSPSEIKPLLQLDRNYLPPNVVLPPEMTNNSTPPTYYNQPGSQNQSQNQSQNRNQQNPNSMNNMNQRNHMGQSQVPQQPGTPQTSRNLPQPAILPFKAPEKISENLSHLPPAQLIELIANLKMVLSGPNANRAPEVFQLSPYLATSAAQALLLMGFINTEVINEAVKAPQFDTTPQMNNANQYQQQPQFNQVNQPPGLPNPPMPMPMSNQPSKWPFLPVPTQQKLAAMPPEQADLIAQVLTIPLEQIPSLEPDKQMMVNNLRAQYL